MPQKYNLHSIGALALLLAIAVGTMVAVAHATEGTADKGPAVAALLAQAQTQGTVRVIVGLQTSYTWRGRHPEGQLPSLEDVVRQQEAVAQAQDAFLARLGGRRVSGIQRMQYIPYLAMQVDADALAFLQAAPEVASIEPDEPQPPDLQDSVPLIGGSHAWEMGYTGEGWLVAILDTGVDGSHPFLQGKVVAEACFSTTGDSSVSLCPNAQPTQTGTGAAVPCPAGVTGCEHGTHVAGIAAGRNPSADGNPNGGVARDARIVAVQVFSRFDSASNCGDRKAPCALSYNSDQMRGLEHIYTLATQFRQRIAAVNISIGSGKYTERCDLGRPAQIDAIELLRSIGIATVASAGNGGHTDGLTLPACLSTVISVGATTKDDAVASFSNSASFLSLLAPGASIYSSLPGGSYGTMHGTSMAAPHVTGAWALLKQVRPGALVNEIQSILTETGVIITDERNGIPKARIRVDVAAERLGATPTPTATLTPTHTPTPSPTLTPNPTLAVDVVAVTVAQANQVNPAVVFNPERDEFLVVWADAQDGAVGWRIFGQRLSPAAVLLGDAFLIGNVGTPTGNEPPYAQVVWNRAAQEYFVAWRSADAGGIIYGQRLAATGERSGDRVALSSGNIDTAYTNFRLALAYNPDDNEYLAAWTDESASGQVLMQRLNPQAEPIDTLTPVCPVCGSLSQRNPGLVYNTIAHEYFMVWQQLAGTSIDIIGQRITRQVTTLTPGIAIAVVDGLQNLPHVTHHPLTNQYMVVWRDGRQEPGSITPTQRATWGRLLAADGTLLGDARAMSSTLSDQRGPVVEWHSGDSSGYLVLWADTRAYGGTSDSNNTDLMARWVDATGQPNNPFPYDLLVSRNYEASNPALVYAAPWSRYLMVWQDTRADTETTPRGFDILAALYATGPTSPTPTVTPTPTQTPTLTPTATATPIAPFGVIVLQQEQDGYTGERDTYLDRYNADEPLGDRVNVYLYLNSTDGQARSILLDFDLSGLHLPPGSKIEAAYLDLYQHTFTGDGTLVIRAYDLNRPWAEQQTTWNHALTDVPWQVPGANAVPRDRKGRGSNPVVLSTQRGNGWKRWEVTTFVRWWLGDPGNHFGIKLQAAGETTGEVFAYFYAKEDWQNPTLRPRLEIHYAPANPITPTVTVTPTPLLPPITAQAFLPMLVRDGQHAADSTSTP